MTLKILPASCFFLYLFKRFRSFNAEKIGSVDQRAAKLLALKVGGLKKKSVNLAITAEACASTFRPGTSRFRAESFSKFGRQ